MLQVFICIHPIQRFDELMKLIEASDGKSVDLYTDDLKDKDVQDDGEYYGGMPDGLRIFPFGKAADQKQG